MLQNPARSPVLTSIRISSLLYLLGLTLAEIFTNLIEPRIGLVLHAVLLVTMLLHSSICSKRLQQRFLLTFALAPLIRLISLSMPLPDFPYVYWYALVGAPLFLAAFVVIRSGHLSRQMLGLNLRRFPAQLLIGITGFIFGAVEYFILHPAPLISAIKIEQMLLPALILLIFTGFLEELIFRGMLQYTALRSIGRFGLVFVAMVFATLHIGYRSILDLIFVFAVALFFGWAAQRTGSILGVTLSHGLTNIALFMLVPFLLASPSSQKQPALSPDPQAFAAAHALPTAVKTLDQLAPVLKPTLFSGFTVTHSAPAATPGWMPGASSMPKTFALQSAPLKADHPARASSLVRRACQAPSEWATYFFTCYNHKTRG